MPIRAVVTDDSVLIREGVARMLEASDAVDVVASCECAEDALHAVAETHADVVLTDIRMPPTHTDEGIALARSLRERHPDVGVVVLSQHVSPEYAIGLLQEGSVGRGYLLKDRLHDIDALESALVSVAGGGCQIDPLVVQALTSARTRPASPLEALTPRELEILGDIAEGANNQAIADRRVLTRRAVEKHASSIFMKLGLADDPDANRRVRSVLVYLRDAA